MNPPLKTRACKYVFIVYILLKAGAVAYFEPDLKLPSSLSVKRKASKSVAIKI